MPHSPALKLDILPAAQRRLWDELGTVPSMFILYGGTALALQIGHRQSVDFDFFAFQPIHHQTLLTSIAFLDQAQIIQQQPNTLSVMVERGDPVQVSFFGVPKLRSLSPPQRIADNGIQIADLLDLAATKAAVIQQRAEVKDYLDIHALITRTHITLPLALTAAGALYGAQFNPLLTLKALSWFEEGNVEQLPPAIKAELSHAASVVDLNQLPTLPV